MNTKSRPAAERLHQLLADTSGQTNAELRRNLQQEGVDVNAFLQRMRAATPTPGPGTGGFGRHVDSAKAAIDSMLAHERVELPLAARTPPAGGTKPETSS